MSDPDISDKGGIDMRCDNSTEEVEESSLSKGQFELWMLHQLDPESSMNHLTYCASIASDTIESWLKEAFVFLLNRHSTLRTTYHIRDNIAVQRVDPHHELDFCSIDCKDWDHSRFLRWRAQESDRPFDLSAHPFRGYFLTNCPCSTNDVRETVMMAVAHHIAADVPSLNILVDDLKSLYHSNRKPSPGPKKTYFDFVNVENGLLEGVGGKKLRNFWRRKLATPAPRKYLQTRSRKGKELHKCHHHLTIDLPEQLTDSIKKIGRSAAKTPYITFLSAFFVLLHKYSAESDVVIGTPFTNRGRQFRLSCIRSG